MRAVIFLAVLAIGLVAGVQVDVDLGAPKSTFNHFWKRCFGSGHARLGLRADWQAQLREMREELGIERLRFHGIFDDDMSVVLDTQNNYEFFNVDQVYGPMLQMGVKPIVELSFMPGLIANCSPWVTNAPPCQTVMHYQGIVMPPVDYAQWTALVAAFAQHLVQQYGLAEVRTWHFEVWNELWGMPYPTDYLALYDASRKALKSVDSQLQVGGPATMQCQYIGEFVRDRAGQFDFVSTHLYPTDPNCTTPGNLGFGDIDCFANTIKKARNAAPKDMPFFVTEYNAGLFNGELLWSSYAAAFIFRNVPLLHDVVDIWSYWTFTDIFEESGMHSAPFEGFNYGIQTNRGIKKPVYRAFQLLNGAGNQIVSGVNVSYDGVISPVNSTVTAFATVADNGLQDNIRANVFVSNFAPQGYTIATETVTVAVKGVDCTKNATVTYIDANSANAYQAWTNVGSPAYPTAQQLAYMKTMSELTPITSYQTTPSAFGSCELTLLLLPYSAVRVDFV
jgi:xylan 1,4-beta-xylosidase